MADITAQEVQDLLKLNREAFIASLDTMMKKYFSKGVGTNGNNAKLTPAERLRERNIERSNKRLEDNTDAIDDNTRATQAEQKAKQDSVKRLIENTKSYRDIDRVHREHINNWKRMSQSEREEYLRLHQAMQQHVEKLSDDKRNGMQKLKDGFYVGSQKLQLWARGLTETFTLMRGFVQANKEIRASIQNGIPILTDYFATYKLGISIEDVIALKKEYINAASAFSGGTVGFTSALSEVRDTVRSLGLSVDDLEMNKAAASIMSSIQAQGVTADLAKTETLGLVKSFQQLHNAVGMNISEFADLHKALIGDTESRALMLRMNLDERKKYRESIMEQTLHLMKTKNLNKEQATAIVNAVKAIQGETAKDRLKRAAKLQLLGGIYGVQGGDAAAAALNAPGGKMDAKQRAQFTDYMDRLNQAAQQSRGDGGANEYLFDSLNQNTGGMLEQMNTFNTELSQSLKNMEKSGEKTNSTLARSEDYMKKIYGKLEGYVSSFQRVLFSAAGLIVAGLLAKTLASGRLMGVPRSTNFIGPLQQSLPTDTNVTTQARSRIWTSISDNFRASVDNIKTKLGGLGDSLTRFKDKLKNAIPSGQSVRNVGGGAMNLIRAHPLMTTAIVAGLIGTAIYQFGLKDKVKSMGANTEENKAAQRRIAQLDREYEQQKRLLAEAQARRKPNDILKDQQLAKEKSKQSQIVDNKDVKDQSEDQHKQQIHSLQQVVANLQQLIKLQSENNVQTTETNKILAKSPTTFRSTDKTGIIPSA